jgi:hypothetical protein
MRLRYTILILVSFIAGCFQATLDLNIQTTWQLPAVIALSVFLVYLGSYPKKQKLVARTMNAPLRTLFPNSTQFEKLMSKDLLQNFEGPDANAIHARKADPSVSSKNNELS